MDTKIIKSTYIEEDFLSDDMEYVIEFASGRYAKCLLDKNMTVEERSKRFDEFRTLEIAEEQQKLEKELQF